MNDNPEAGALERAVERFAVPLRMGSGIDELAYADLCEALRSCATAWRGQDQIPKRAASMLAELFPAIEGCAGIYDQDCASRVLECCVELHDLVMACTRDGDADGAEHSGDRVRAGGDDALADGMHVVVRLRHDFTITDAQRLLGAARAAYLEGNPGVTKRDAEELVTGVADVMFTLLERDGLVGDAAGAKLSSHRDDGLQAGGWRAQVTINETRRLRSGPDCFQRGDVFALPPQA